VFFVPQQSRLRLREFSINSCLAKNFRSQCRAKMICHAGIQK
jgi:hypothetical protein